MKPLSALRIAAPGLICAALAATAAQGAILFQDDFNAYTDAPLAGQGGWTAGAGAGAVQVASGAVVFAQGDALNVFSPTFTASNDLYYGLDVKLTALPGPADSGRYNLSALGSGLVDSGLNRARAGVRQWNSNAEFDLVNNAAANVPFDGASTYRLVVRYVSGVSETFWFGSGALDEAAPYWTTTAGGGARNVFGFMNSGAVGASFDNLIVATSFAEVVPEPASLGLLGVLGASFLRRRRA